MRCQALDHLVVVGRLAIPATNRATRQRQLGLTTTRVGIEELLDAQAVAAGAGAGRVVERKQARLEFGQAIAADVAGEAIREDDFFCRRHRPCRRCARRPSASRSAVSNDSVRRSRMSSLTLKRSTIASIGVSCEGRAPAAGRVHRPRR